MCEDFFDSYLKLKIFGSDGKMGAYTVSDGVKIDEVNYNEARKAFAALKNTEKEKHIILEQHPVKRFIRNCLLRSVKTLGLHRY